MEGKPCRQHEQKRKLLLQLEKVATKVDTKVTAEEQVIAEKPIEKKKSKKRKRYLQIQIIFCVDQ